MPSASNNCLWCQRPVNSKRRLLPGLASSYCTNKCMTSHAEVIVSTDPSFASQAAPPGSAPDVSYIKIPKIKIPKINTINRPPPDGADIWTLLAWAAQETYAQYRSRMNDGPIPVQNQTYSIPRAENHGYANSNDNNSYNNGYNNSNANNNRQRVATPLPSKEDLLQDLGLAPSASIDDVERIYKVRARQVHPDVGGSHQKMAELNSKVAQLREIYANSK